MEFTNLQCQTLQTAVPIVAGNIIIRYSHLQGCQRSGKSQGKKYFFKVREKSGNFTKSQGILYFFGKVREKSGNFVELFS